MLKLLTLLIGRARNEQLRSLCFFHFLLLAVATLPGVIKAEPRAPQFKAIAFYTGKSDKAHLSFLREANQWFPKMSQLHGFSYTSTTNWDELNPEVLSAYQVVLFLDTRPEKPAQRPAF